jgi:hypothetical protein
VSVAKFNKSKVTVVAIDKGVKYDESRDMKMDFNI